MSCYQVTVPFASFRCFYTALQTLGRPPDHYSTILYQVGDTLQLEYRVGHAPIAAHHVPDCSSFVYTCPTRPARCVYAFLATPPTRVTKWPDVTSVHATTLREHWIYTTPTATYRLTKAATAATKEEASRTPPRFYITVVATTDRCVSDLLGRFRLGVAECLQIQRMPGGTPVVVHDVVTSAFY